MADSGKTVTKSQYKCVQISGRISGFVIAAKEMLQIIDWHEGKMREDALRDAHRRIDRFFSGVLTETEDLFKEKRITSDGWGIIRSHICVAAKELSEIISGKPTCNSQKTS